MTGTTTAAALRGAGIRMCHATPMKMEVSDGHVVYSCDVCGRREVGKNALPDHMRYDDSLSRYVRIR